MLDMSMITRESVMVGLTQDEVDEAFDLGNRRCAAKPPSIRSHSSGYHDDPDRARPHRIGALGEKAYSKHTQIPMDTSILLGGDSTDFDGVEVKTSTNDGSGIKLLVKKHEYARKVPKKYVLARVDENNPLSVELVGEITREDFDKHKEGIQYGDKAPNWGVGKRYLSSVIGHGLMMVEGEL